LPEEPEVETEKLRETIHEEMEHQSGRLLRTVALSTAITAAFAAFAALEAGHTVNEALMLKMDAARLETAASDQWSYYQAKGIKLAVEQSTAASWLAAGRKPPEELASQARRYQAEQDSIRRVAQGLERERDAKSREADGLLERHHSFADAVALFQVAIALGAVAALTRMRWVWIASLLVAVAGMLMLARPLLS
jgi:uncharacterized protein DUF4337